MTTSAPLAALELRARPLVLAGERTLPVLEPLRDLLPAGLPRGSAVAVRGGAARSLALALLAAASRAGSWTAVVGVGDLGWRAAGELGLDLARTVLVDPVPAGQGPDVLAALVDGFDGVLVGPGARLSPALTRRVAARARERGAVLVGAAAAPGPDPLAGVADIRAQADAVGWEGLGRGSGRLRGRQVAVRLEGRRVPGRDRRARLWLPGPDGAVAGWDPVASVAVLAR